jgi:hypothetical protein
MQSLEADCWNFHRSAFSFVWAAIKKKGEEMMTDRETLRWI